MLPAHIIEELLRRERERRRANEHFVDPPVPEPLPDDDLGDEDDDGPADRGVAIVDFTV